MNKTRNRQPASDTRTARRSIVELTEGLRRAVDNEVLATPAIAPVAAADHPPQSERAAARPDRAARPSSDSAAEMVVTIAKDYQSRMLDNIKASLNAALDQAKDFAEPARGNEKDDADAESDVLTALGAATAAYRAEALELMQANVASTLGFARELAGARTAADFVALSGAQARKSCEFMLKQAGALKSLAGAVANEREGQG